LNHDLISPVVRDIFVLGALALACVGEIDTQGGNEAPSNSAPSSSAPSSSVPSSAGTAVGSPGAAQAADVDEPISFLADVRPILLDNCGRCHASGSLPNFASASADSSYAVALRESEEILEELEEGAMPADTCSGAPGSRGCVSLAEFELIRDWVEAGAPE
jgi:hypothetical protein